MTDPAVSIRPAQPADAAFAAPLIQQTIGSIGHALTGTETDFAAAEVIAEFFGQWDNRLSHQHTLIAEQRGQAVGLAVLYPGALAHALDEPFRGRLRALGLPHEIQSEGQSGELYLDTLAAAFPGQGIGTHLLRACIQRAQTLGLPLALLVEDGNPARRLYERSGFGVVGREEIAGHWYSRMHR